MSHSRAQIRNSQLITTFGPGSMMDLPNYSIIVGGLDTWNGGGGGEIISEPRLIAKIKALLEMPHLELRSPPKNSGKLGETEVGITGWQFPEWFVTQDAVPLHGPGSRVRSRAMVHRHSLVKGKFEGDDKGKLKPVVPVRFVRACEKGHIGDIDWRYFVHRERINCLQQLNLDELGTSGDLAEVRIRCDCGANRKMADATQKELMSLGTCNGDRPWLGPRSREEGGCGVPNRLLIRTASNAYFSQVMSVISIPDVKDPLADIVELLWDQGLKDVDSEAVLESFRKFNPTAKKAFAEFSGKEILNYLSKRKNAGAPQAHQKPVKQAEIETLLGSKDELGIDVPEGDFFARSLPRSIWASSATESVDKVVLVHRLREVVALLGFTRFEAQSPDIDGDLDLKVEPARLGRQTDWLPAYENRGEGVFVSFKKDVVDAWAKSPDSLARGRELEAGFNNWLREHEGIERRFPGLPFYLLHSISHMLITAVSLECGYPASSIKERIYAGEFGYGILLYTGTPDSEGTLGGLVEAGRNIKDHLESALRSNLLCSNDPVCAQHDVKNALDSRYLLGASCHGCLLISETSCEQHNDFLDRALVVPTVSHQDAAFFEGL